eukprot:COSAG06_NODE_4_length_41837_cov_204.557597_10_plen_41_part_00
MEGAQTSIRRANFFRFLALRCEMGSKLNIAKKHSGQPQGS